MNLIKLYQCFHDSGSKPKNKYLSEIRPALWCGADIEWRRDENDFGIKDLLKDNTGDNISKENTQYSELTGYYWIWKNVKDVDYIGIEHYRRHFIKHDAHIDDYVHTEDLMTDKEIIPILNEVDFIIPVHQSLANFSIYDLYELCFHEQAKEIVRWMKAYFKDRPNFVEELYREMAYNYLCRGNMLITSKKEFDAYCTEMFAMIDFMKANMEVRPDSRVWGYVTELFPMIYIRANNKTFKEIDVAVDDFDQDLQKDRVYTTMCNKEEDFSQKDPQVQIDLFESL